MKLIGICGEPGTGKSTLVREVVRTVSDNTNGSWFVWKHGLMVITYNEKARIGLFGIYKQGELFPGTDRLSMGVMGQVDTWGPAIKKRFADYTLIWEGDRLWCDSFMKWAGKPTCFYLTVSEGTQSKRFAKRGSNQSATWLKGRRTRVANCYNKWPGALLYNETKKDLANNARVILWHTI